jgi:hypothetical protein
MVKNNKKFNIALIGCGRIGERHFQSLMGLEKKSFNLQVCDKFAKNLSLDKLSKKLSMKNISMKGGELISPSFVKDIKDLHDNIDVCLIATKADVRKSIVEELLTKKNVKYLILEKVAFQSVKDFKDIIELTERKNIKCYVNCPLRIQPLYSVLTDRFDLDEDTKFTYEYSDDFKISSSLIHILDLFCYFCDDFDIKIYTEFKKVIDNPKYKDFVDFVGEVNVINSNGHILIVKKGNKKFTETLEIDNINVNIHVTEGGEEKDINQKRLGNIIINKKNEDEKLEFSTKFSWQSELTMCYIMDLYNTGELELPTLRESFATHKPMIESFNKFLSETKGETFTICPIT